MRGRAVWTIRATRALTAVGAVAMIPLLAGCGSRLPQWFDPEWDRVLAGEAARAGTPITPPTASLSEDRVTDSGKPVTLPEPSADGTLALSIEQAVLLTLRRNRDLSVAQLEPVITGAFELIERGRFDPEVFASAQFAREQSLETARSTGEQFSVLGDDGSLGIGVRQELPTGTTIELQVTEDRSISNRAPEQQTARVGITLTQALLRGFEPVVNLAAVRQAELDTLASRYELRGFVEALVAETENAYWDLVMARRQIEIFERSLEFARDQNDQVRQRIEVGVLPETESAASETEIAIREQALIDARSEADTAALRLRRLVDGGTPPQHAPGAPTLRPVSVASMSEGALDEEDLGTLENRIALAQQKRPDLNEARLRLDQDRLETIRTRNGLLPRLDVFIAYGKTGFADTFPDAFRELDSDTYDISVGANFSQTLGREAARGRDLAARATRQQAAAAVNNLAQIVEFDVRLAATEVERARRQIDATTTTRVLQERTVAAEQERFAVGASTSLLVARAQRDLLEAEVAEVEAVIAYRVALINLYLAEGTLLERRGVLIAG